MKLTIVIVNYNVKFFLEQCLLSVRKAIQQLKQSNPGFNTEIIVVDNNSVDSSLAMLHNKFPEVQLIANKDNKGFSVANNQAIIALDQLHSAITALSFKISISDYIPDNI